MVQVSMFCAPMQVKTLTAAVDVADWYQIVITAVLHLGVPVQCLLGYLPSYPVLCQGLGAVAMHLP